MVAVSGAGLSLSPLQLAGYMALVIGGIQFLAGWLHFGKITKFISRSVVVAYSAAIGLILMVGQLHSLLGMGDDGGGGSGFLRSLWAAVGACWRCEVSWLDTAIGAVALLIFLAFRRWRPRWPGTLVGLLVLGLLARGYVWWCDTFFTETVPTFKMIKDMDGFTTGMPTLSWLSFSSKHFTLLPSLFGSAMAIAIIGMLESASITKSLAAKSGQIVDTNQELMGMGAGNMACALFGAVPGSSSFTRSAVCYQSGAATQLASVFSSVMVLLVLLFAMPVFNYIPVAALAAQLICVGATMIVPRQMRVACCSTRSDAAVFAGTLAAALLLRLDIAIYVGIGLSLALFLQKTSSPMLVEYAFDESGSLAQLKDKSQRVNPQIAIIHVEGELFFGAADVFLTQVRRQAADENIRVFILRLKNARHLDASTVMALESLHEYLEKSGRHLLISGCTPDILTVIRNSGIVQVLGEENIFEGDPTNPNVSTRRALIRASQVLASRNADIRIFYDQRRSKDATAPTEPEYTLNFQI
jgi:SulP family sulfate permease